MSLPEYDFKEHLHRYGVWTAARAQRGSFASNKLVSELINKINLKDEAFRLDHNITVNEFDKWHADKCKQLLQYVEEKVAFGRAAKIISIYMKTVIVVPNCKESLPLISNIHPPIDSILLKGLVLKNELARKYLVPWTKMSQVIYSEIIDQIRNAYPILWMAEYCWKPEKEKLKSEA